MFSSSLCRMCERYNKGRVEAVFTPLCFFFLFLDCEYVGLFDISYFKRERPRLLYKTVLYEVWPKVRTHLSHILYFIKIASFYMKTFLLIHSFSLSLGIVRVLFIFCLTSSLLLQKKMLGLVCYNRTKLKEFIYCYRQCQRSE